jgi:hypothetical protein
VRFFDGRRLVGTARHGTEGLFTVRWQTRKAKRGAHVLRALVTDRRGGTASATRVARVCR